MTREEALAALQEDYGILTMDGDPEWVESMVQNLADPEYAAWYLTLRG